MIQSDSLLTVGIIFYGDFPELADRCLSSIMRTADWRVIQSVRIGCNEISQATRQILREQARQIPQDVELLFFDSPVNRYKYPLMRKMLATVNSLLMMWFDDDSYIEPGETQQWWTRISAEMETADLLGKFYYQKPNGEQLTAVCAQPWYAGVALPATGTFIFPTGAWWTTRTEFLRKWDYPFLDIIHNGGDVMLGELARQQALRVRHYFQGVRINADDDGRHGKAARRGAKLEPVWTERPADPERFRQYHAFDLSPSRDI